MDVKKESDSERDKKGRKNMDVNKSVKSKDDIFEAKSQRSGRSNNRSRARPTKEEVELSDIEIQQKKKKKKQ